MEKGTPTAIGTAVTEERDVNSSNHNRVNSSSRGMPTTVGTPKPRYVKSIGPPAIVWTVGVLDTSNRRGRKNSWDSRNSDGSIVCKAETTSVGLQATAGMLAVVEMPAIQKQNS
jgi:hypothetical protein